MKQTSLLHRFVLIRNIFIIELLVEILIFEPNRDRSITSEILGTVQDGESVDIMSIEGEWFGIPFRGANNGLAFMHNSVFEPACQL